MATRQAWPNRDRCLIASILSCLLLLLNLWRVDQTHTMYFHVVQKISYKSTLPATHVPHLPPLETAPRSLESSIHRLTVSAESIINRLID